jgi:hypothetical protein
MTQNFDIVCRFDEALDPDGQSDEQRLAFPTSWAPADLAFLPGEPPTVFSCRRLAVTEMRQVQAYQPSDQPWEAFARGVVSVRDLRCEGGSRRSWVRPSEKPLTPAAIEKAGFDIREINEVGMAIIGRSSVGKGRPAVWRLPATSADALEALARHRVAQRARDAARSKEPPAATPAPSNASAGATSGAATAMEKSGAL